MRCPNPMCGVDVPNGTPFCDQCGTFIVQSVSEDTTGASVYTMAVQCPHCGNTAIQPGQRYCDQCNTALPPTDLQMSKAETAKQQIPRALLTVEPSGVRFLLDRQTEYVIGRCDATANWAPDIDLGPYGGHELGVSRRHCRIRTVGTTWVIEDMGSLNGTRLNQSERLQPHQTYPLPGEASLQLGELTLVFKAL